MTSSGGWRNMAEKGEVKDEKQQIP